MTGLKPDSRPVRAGEAHLTLQMLEPHTLICGVLVNHLHGTSYEKQQDSSM